VLRATARLIMLRRDDKWAGIMRKEKRLPYLLSMGLVALMSLIGEAIHPYFAPANLVMLYLLALAVSASLWGRGPAAATALASVMVFDFLFVPPKYSFTVEDTEYLLTFIILFSVGILISELAARMRENAFAAEKRELYTSRLFAYSQNLTHCLDVEQVLQSFAQHADRFERIDCQIYVQQQKEWQQWSQHGFVNLAEGTKEVIEKTMRAVPSTWSSLKPASLTDPPLLQHEALLRDQLGHYLFPLTMGGQNKGLIICSVKLGAQPFGEEEERLLDSIVRQTNLAFERISLLHEAQQAELLRESEKLHTALLNSISHDLRTPLVSITGALSSMAADLEALTAFELQELIRLAYDKSPQLNTLVGELLDMSRIEAGALRLKLRPCEVREIIGIAISQAKDKLGRRRVQQKIDPQLVEMKVDIVLFIKVIYNLLDNAIKFSAEGTRILVSADRLQDGLILMIADNGLGIPAEELDHVFDKFYQVSRVQKRSGSGLGLAICKGIVEAHRGQIWIESAEEKGTKVFIRLFNQPAETAC